MQETQHSISLNTQMSIILMHHLMANKPKYGPTLNCNLYSVTHCKQSGAQDGESEGLCYQFFISHQLNPSQLMHRRLAEDLMYMKVIASAARRFAVTAFTALHPPVKTEIL